MLNPIPAAANPSRTASGTLCHQTWAANTSSRWETARPAMKIAVFRYICQQSRCRRPVARKCSSTRRRTSSWKALFELTAPRPPQMSSRLLPLQVLVDPILDLARERRRRPDELLLVGQEHDL